jgi:hypothetical protein
MSITVIVNVLQLIEDSAALFAIASCFIWIFTGGEMG